MDESNATADTKHVRLSAYEALGRLNAAERVELNRVSERLAVVYRAIGWGWGSDRKGASFNERDIPDARRMYESVLSLLASAMEFEGVSGVSSGGLWVCWDPSMIVNCEPGDAQDEGNFLRFIVRFEP